MTASIKFQKGVPKKASCVMLGFFKFRAAQLGVFGSPVATP